MTLRERGFTLIELLIVLIILGILATLAIPQYTGYVEKARAGEALTMIGALKTGEAAYKLESGAYTTDITNLGVTGVQTQDNTVTYWYYSVSAAGTNSYTLKANRSQKSGGDTSKYITFTWSDTAGASWGGNHPGVPKQ